MSPGYRLLAVLGGCSQSGGEPEPANWLKRVGNELGQNTSQGKRSEKETCCKMVLGHQRARSEKLSVPYLHLSQSRPKMYIS